jgi:hypothetical protein
VRIQEVFLLDDLRSQLVEFLPHVLEFGSALLSGGINAKDNVGSLIGIVEAVELFLHVVNVTSVSQPVDLRLLIEEQSGTQTLTKVLQTEPLEDGSLNSLTSELHGGALSMEIS